jgi:Glycosyl transferases group 1
MILVDGLHIVVTPSHSFENCCKMAKIFYYTYDHNIPTGGQRDTYRHVDILNSHGVEAYVLHTTANHRLTWFTNKTPVISLTDFKTDYTPATDYPVLPEDLGEGIANFPGRKVIFNKGVYNGFKAFGSMTPLAYPYRSHDIVCVLSVSDHNSEYLKLSFPHLRVIQVRPGVDTSLFSFTPLAEKQRQIVCVPKAETQITTLYHMLQARAEAGLNLIRSCNWIVLRGYLEAEVARILKEALIVIFLSIEEGFPRILLEAMSCGCLIASFGGGPITEFLPQAYRFEYGDLVAIIRYIEQVVAAFPNDMSRWDGEIKAALALTRELSLEQEAAAVMAAWSQVFEIAPSSPVLYDS